ncbi:MAG: hypothetical protein QG657_797, partial [Acidobacteriota bacterium]|nr:hypothetical protein [Acidobacteriota bacterium]
KNVETRIMTILEKRTDKCLSCWAVNFCTACLGDIVYNSSYWSFPDSHCKFIKRIVTKIIFKMAEHRRKTERTMKTETGIKNDL